MKKKLLMLAMLLSAFAFGAMAQVQDETMKTLVDENFDAFTEGSEQAPATTDIASYSSGKLGKVLTGWKGSKVYEAGGMLKIADGGNLETAYLSGAVRGQVAKITLRVRSLADYGAAVNVKIGYSATYQLLVYDGEWHDLTVFTADITTTSKVKIEPFMAINGILVDGLKIETGESLVVVPEAKLPSQADGVSFTAQWTHASSTSEYLLDVYTKAPGGEKEYVLKDEVVKPLSSYAKEVEKKVTGLDETKTYYYTVRGKNKAGYLSDYSNEVQVMKVLESIDAPKAVAATNITTTGFTANWEAVAEAKRYAVRLTCTETLPADTRIAVIADDFSKVTLGSETSVEFGKTQEVLDAYTKAPGWFGVGHAFAAGYMVLAPYGSGSTLTTPALKLDSDNGAFGVNIKMAEGNFGKYYAGAKVTVNLFDADPNADGFAGTPVESHEVTLDADSYKEYTVSFAAGTADSYVQISYSGDRKLFIDEMAVEQNKKAGEQLTEVVAEVETEDTHYDFTLDNPKTNAVYSYAVVAIGETVVDGEITDLYSPVSNTINVTLSGSTGIGGITDNAEGVSVTAHDGVITVQLPAAGKVMVYDLTGRLIASVNGRAGANTLSVAPGQVVVVRAGGKSVKLAV